MFQYDMLARSLASGNGFRWYAPADQARLTAFIHFDMAGLPRDPRGIPTTFRAPLYPAFLSIIYLVNGINGGRFFAARAAQAVMGAGLAPLTYQLARKLPLLLSVEESERAARWAAAAVACYPTLLLYPLALATENLFFPLVLVSVWLLLALGSASARSTLGVALAAGIALGLAALTRSIIVPFALLAVGWIWLSLRLRLAALVALLAFSATVLPWVIRNTLLAHRLTGIETSVGYNLYVGYHPQSTGTFVFGPSLDLLRIVDDEQRDRIGMQAALGFIRADPGRVPYLAMRRLGYFFDLELRGFTYFYSNDFLGHIPSIPLAGILLVLGAPFAVLALSAAVGWARLAAGREAALLLLLLVSYLLPHVLILSEERFHLVLVPLMSILAAASWVRMRAGLPAGKLLISLLLVTFLLANWSFELARDGNMLVQMLGPVGNQLFLPY